MSSTKVFTIEGISFSDGSFKWTVFDSSNRLCFHSKNDSVFCFGDDIDSAFDKFASLISERIRSLD